MKKMFKLRVLLIVILIIGIAYNFVSQEIKIRSQRQEIKGFEQKVKEEEKEHLYLTTQNEHKMDDEYVIKEAREKLRFIKQGEITIIDKNQ
ncbi:septum formation initiator family protein [Oceanirhabdus sp. W0125-5]|uniref:septum formation initiator family protein n=1 Tax=Oceanirhabdus sp. W0125-5 TaxID=2999116 RepID=UPI0022F2C075|nr:septum formation initiator family protein [Oceanirhabdus sp. W0125-5]WBW97939.1 septum formation initiator family protein [Oceanirhabdus sp. W0125-5]